MHTIEIGGPGMKEKEGHMNMVGAVGVGVQTTVCSFRFHSPTSFTVASWQWLIFFSFRNWKKTSEVGISVGP